MSEQYLRKVSLIVGDQSGTGLDLSDLHIKFTVRNATVQTPKFAQIRVYNLSADTARRIQKEFVAVFLQAGYEGSYGLIFKGTISKFMRGKENATDTFLDIVAYDSDIAYNFTVQNSTLSAGWTPSAAYKAVMTSFNTNDVVAGYLPEVKDQSAPRGKAMFGMARDYMQTFADSQKSDWYVDDGKLHVLPKKGVLPGAAIVLNYQTGMIGIPQQTLDGIVVSCLLNPNIRAGGQIQINNASITTTTVIHPFTAADSTYPGLDAGDGNYITSCVTHEGDTRGAVFETKMICIAVDGTAPLGGPTLTAVPDGQ